MVLCIQREAMFLFLETQEMGILRECVPFMEIALKASAQIIRLEIVLVFLALTIFQHFQMTTKFGIL